MKSSLHPRNKHRERYDFKKLIESCPELGPFVQLNACQDLSIDFFNPEAVKMLNKALLKHYYAMAYWDIPPHYLCPPIPGRADYIHYLADLVGSHQPIKCLDIGVGANCIYPIIGSQEYGWSFIGTDIDPKALEAANHIIQQNPSLKGKIELRLQANPKNIFRGVIKQDERIDVTLCNPPFHASAGEARSAALRKLNNLTQSKITKPILNFGGQKGELYCEGGESRFLRDMIQESKLFAAHCLWFSSLVSKQDNLAGVYEALKKVQAVEVKTIPMGQGNKKSRIVAWSFLTPEKRQQWGNKK